MTLKLKEELETLIIQGGVQHGRILKEQAGEKSHPEVLVRPRSLLKMIFIL